MKRFSRLHLEDMGAILPLSLLPMLMLVHSLIASGTWDDSIEAWRGNFYLLGIPMNPWEVILPGLGSLILCFILLSWVALRLARHVKSGSPIFRLRMAMALGLTSLGAIAFLASALYGSFAYVNFIDVRINGIIPPNSLCLILSLSALVLFVNAYRVIRVAGNK